MEKNEPNRTWSVQIGYRFGSVQKQKKIWFDYLFWPKTGPNRKCSPLTQGALIRAFW
jgi:hypothetical protein